MWTTYLDRAFDRRSISGTVTKLNGAPCLWRSQKQKSTSLSTTESEFIAATEAAKDGLWLTTLFKELKIQVKPTIYVDHQSALKLIKNPTFHMRSKHIDTRFKIIQESYQRKQLEFLYVSSENELADILTKVLAKPTFNRLIQQLGLTTCSKLNSQWLFSQFTSLPHAH